MSDSTETRNGFPLHGDWLALWQEWWRAAGIRGPLNGDVDHSVDASLIRTVGDQLGFVNINAVRAGDAELERRITEEVASYGRQLGRVLDALDVLIRQGGTGAQLGADDQHALTALTELRAEVERVKIRSAAERVDQLVADVEALSRNGHAGAAALERLRQALDGAQVD